MLPDFYLVKILSSITCFFEKVPLAERCFEESSHRSPLGEPHEFHTIFAVLDDTADHEGGDGLRIIAEDVVDLLCLLIQFELRIAEVVVDEPGDHDARCDLSNLDVLSALFDLVSQSFGKISDASLGGSVDGETGDGRIIATEAFDVIKLSAVLLDK